MSIRGFDVSITYGDPVPKGQTTLEEAARFTSDHPRALQYEEFDSLKGEMKE